MHGKNDRKLGFAGLVGVSAGSAVASGIFAFPGDFAAAGAGTAAVLTGWLTAGAGMLAVVMCFFGLGETAPKLNGGIYFYAKEGFGKSAGFYTVWSYWLSALFGNLSFLSLLAVSVLYFLPQGSKAAVLIGQSLFIWCVAAVLLKGTEYAAKVNLMVAAAKLIPIAAFAAAVVFFRAFDLNIFMDNFFGQDTGYSMLHQIKATTGISLWAFVGIEGAAAVSARARYPKDVGRAIAVSFVCVLLIYLLVSVLSMGVMTRQELASLGNPPLAYVFEKAAGKAGAVIINAGVILALGGAYLGYNLLASECMAASARQGAFSGFFARAGRNGSPAAAVLVTCGAIQLLTIAFTMTGASYQNIYEMAARLCAPVYLMSAAYYLKLCVMREKRSAMQCIIAAAGTLYGLYMMYALGFGEVFTLGIFLAPGTVLHISAQKEKNQRILESTADKLLIGAVILIFAVSVCLTAAGVTAPLFRWPL